MQEQNSVLRAVVAQMRQDMEHLGHPTVQTEVQHPGTLDAMSTKGGADAQHAPYLPALPTQPAAVSSNVSHAGVDSAFVHFVWEYWVLNIYG